MSKMRVTYLASLPFPWFEFKTIEPVTSSDSLPPWLLKNILQKKEFASEAWGLFILNLESILQSYCKHCITIFQQSLLNPGIWTYEICKRQLTPLKENNGLCTALCGSFNRDVTLDIVHEIASQSKDSLMISPKTILLHFPGVTGKGAKRSKNALLNLYSAVTWR